MRLIEITNAKTKKLKERVKEHGRVWRVLQNCSNVVCFNNGPGLKISSVETDHIRWVQPTDIEFKVIE